MLGDTVNSLAVHSTRTHFASRHLLSHLRAKCLGRKLHHSSPLCRLFRPSSTPPVNHSSVYPLG